MESTGTTHAAPAAHRAAAPAAIPASGPLILALRLVTVLVGVATVVFVVLAGHEGAVQTWLH